MSSNESLGTDAQLHEAVTESANAQAALSTALTHTCELAFAVADWSTEFHHRFADLGYTVDEETDPNRKMDHCWLTYDVGESNSLVVRYGIFSDFELEQRDSNFATIKAQTLRLSPPDLGLADPEFLARTRAEFTPQDMFQALGIIATCQPRIPTDAEVSKILNPDN